MPVECSVGLARDSVVGVRVRRFFTVPIGFVVGAVVSAVVVAFRYDQKLIAVNSLTGGRRRWRSSVRRFLR